MYSELRSVLDQSLVFMMPGLSNLDMLIICIRFQRLDRPYYDLSTAKLEGLGFKFKSIEEMLDDCISSLVEQGYLSLAK